MQCFPRSRMTTLPQSEQSGFGLQFVEFGLTMAGLILAVALPRMGTARFQAIERFFGGIARRKNLSVLLVGLSVIVLRVALLPLMPIPLPFVHDDFSFLLAADTFLHGRLANPTPAMWMHFETFHVTMLPTYASMYFPGVGLVLAGGKLLFGNPWFGLLIGTSLMCASICWMLQAWLPPTWALLGGFLSVLRLGLFSYWINTYTGGGSITALGGALILGALPRFLRTTRPRYVWLIAVGVVLVAFTRPYEGMLLCLPVLAVLGRWVFLTGRRGSRVLLVKLAAGPLALLIAAGAWLSYYDYRAFGSPTTLPYTVDRATYAIAPYFIWQKARPEPHYRHDVMRQFYTGFELNNYRASRTLIGAVREHIILSIVAIEFFAGIALLPFLVMTPWAVRDRRTRFLVLCLLVLALGMSIQIYGNPHYMAPFTAALYALALQSARHLWVWRPGGRGFGRAIVRASVLVCALMAGLRPFDRILHFPVANWPAVDALMGWYGPDHFGTERAGVEQMLEELPGQQLAIVRYARTHQPKYEWAYNGADIDGSKVIWAREMDAASNRELIRYYKNRKVWLVEPDQSPAVVVPYPKTETASGQPQQKLEGVSRP